ncbi:conserved hypothetical protein [Gloeothece citriformis PCC 7424]|uniref:DUF2996 domain-containing protein n=1 Tax=Gloeothece citriformis (strain PCC 7424) TaxID=65393 RepID=B7KFK7_GLOC7|nr:DUF2996 domain-containing protein [Gloeothece citriformis]ACK73332.1 conserved hypothetical protein [Gloeothece citriformis PCC 7424]
MAEETTPNSEAKPKAAKPKPEAEEGQAKPAAAKKKEKEPAIEDKPFTEFMEQHFTPALKQALEREGLKDVDLTFKKDKLPLTGSSSNEECWQVRGSWAKAGRQFNLYFLDEDISGKKAFSCSTGGKKPSIIESFMIDERKVNLDLMVLYTLQRLNGQKWLTKN